MPQTQQALFSIIRNRLTQNAGMTAQVASNAITVSLQQDPVTYPAIRIKITGAGENRLPGFLAGNITFGIYTKSNQPTAHLASIYNTVKTLIHLQTSVLRTTNMGVGEIYEQFCEYPIYQQETGYYYLTARYGYVAQHLQ
jgi:hypothetical protein